VNARINQPRDPGQERDVALEVEIDAAYNQMVDPAKTDEESRAHFHEMCRLIARRSPQRIQKMELDRRIALKRARETQ
jgi:hypothetical protein